MGIKVDGFVGTNPRTDGQNQDALFRFGRDGSLIVAQSHGKYFEAAQRGCMFVATNPTAIVIPVDSGLTNAPVLLNPYGSGVVLEIIRVQLTQTAATPTAPSALEWFSVSAGGPIGTLATFTAFTNIPPVNILSSTGAGGKISQARYSVVNTITTGLKTYLMGAGIGLDTWAAAATYPPFQVTVDYDGIFLLPPGIAILLNGTVSSSSSTYHVNILYIENPFPGMGA